jgi:hypothetical protein
MKKIIVFILIISTMVSGCSIAGGSFPSTDTQTSTVTILPSDTSTPIPPTSTPAPTFTPVPPEMIALDFIAQLCNAQWMNGGQHLIPCPDINADHSGGYAVLLDPTTEDLPVGTPVLLTIPATNGYAALFLRYPPITIQAGDRFRTTLRCQGNTLCDVEYALEYFDTQGKYSGPFRSWNFRYGDPEINVDEDLSALAGQTVELVLTLRPNNDTPQQDQSMWIAPYIYRSDP